jgi:hypothetical protein
MDFSGGNGLWSPILRNISKKNPATNTTHNKPMKTKTFITAAVLATAMHASAATTAIISVNFQAGQSPADGPAVTGTAGYIAAGNWNNGLGNWSQGVNPNQVVNLSNLVTSSGAVSSLDMSYTSFGTWDYATGDGNGTNADMMSGFLDNMQVSGSITISDLMPNKGYDVYAYFNNTSTTYIGARGTDGISTNSYYAVTNNPNYPLGGTNGYIVSQDDNVVDGWTTANAILFSGYTGDTFTIDAAPAPGAPPGPYKLTLNGIQIVVTVPEPSSTALLGLGGVALMLRRRRK